MTANHDSSTMLCEEILLHAKQESERIIYTARQDAKRLLESAIDEARRIDENGLEKAQRDAVSLRDTILSGIPIEVERLRVANVESLLESIREEARQQLIDQTGFEYRHALITLAAYAINRMAGNNFILKMSEQDRLIFLDDLPGEIAHRIDKGVSNITISYEKGIVGGGVVVEDIDGHQAWDNGLLSRLNRMWPQLRQSIAAKISLTPKNE